jgi:WD40 repeat protein
MSVTTDRAVGRVFRARLLLQRSWRMTDGLFSGTIPGNNSGVRALAFSPDQKQLAAGSGDRQYSGSVRFYSMTTGRLLTEWRQDPNNAASYITAVAFAPFGRLFAYARQDALVTATFAP